MSSQVYFISDLHLDHRNVLKFEPVHRPFADIEAHNQWLFENWRSVVNKRDVVYVLGDVSWTRAGLQAMKQLPGQKHLIMGNHDGFPLQEYLEVFRVIRPSPWVYRRHWLSHCPIHPDELRGRDNVHGHVHSNSIKDVRYINVSVEAINGIPRTLEQLHKLQAVKHYVGDI